MQIKGRADSPGVAHEGHDPMAWEKHGDRKYFYRSVREDGRVPVILSASCH